MACLCNHQDETVKIPKQPIWMFVLGAFYPLGCEESRHTSGQCKQGVSQFTSLFEQLCIINTA